MLGSDSAVLKYLSAYDPQEGAVDIYSCSYHEWRKFFFFFFFFTICLPLGCQFKSSHALGFRTKSITRNRFCPDVARIHFLWSHCSKSSLLLGASQVAQWVKNPPASGGDIRDMGLIPGWGRSPGGGHSNPLQYSCLVHASLLLTKLGSYLDC